MTTLPIRKMKKMLPQLNTSSKIIDKGCQAQDSFSSEGDPE